MSEPRVLEDIEVIKSSINDIKSTQLTGRYYTPSVEKIAGTPSSMTVSPLPTTWQGSHPKYTSGKYIIETSVASNQIDNNYPLSNAFEESDSSSYRANSTTSNPWSVTITLPDPLKVKEFKAKFTSAEYVVSFSVLGSTNKSTWMRLYYRERSLPNTEVIRLTENIGAYTYYRFVIEVNQTETIGLSNVRISEYEIDTIFHEFTLAEITSPLLDGLRIMIRTPDNYSMTGVSRNLLDSIYVDTLLLPSRYYELVYSMDESSSDNRYLAREVV